MWNKKQTWLIVLRGEGVMRFIYDNVGKSALMNSFSKIIKKWQRL